MMGDIMLSRRLFLKGVLSALAGFGCIATPLLKHDDFSALTDSGIHLSGFEPRWFHLRKTAEGYTVPVTLATVAGSSLILTKSFQPGRRAVYSAASWADLVEKILQHQGPAAERSALVRWVLGPAVDIDLRNHYLEIPDSLIVAAGLKNSSLILAFDGKKGFLQAA